jgi:hypothetical protein
VELTEAADQVLGPAEVAAQVLGTAPAAPPPPELAVEFAAQLLGTAPATPPWNSPAPGREAHRWSKASSSPTRSSAPPGRPAVELTEAADQVLGPAELAGRHDKREALHFVKSLSHSVRNLFKSVSGDKSSSSSSPT